MGAIRNFIDDNEFVPEDLTAFEAQLFVVGVKRWADLDSKSLSMSCSRFHYLEMQWIIVIGLNFNS